MNTTSNSDFTQDQLTQWADAVSDQLNALTTRQATTGQKNLPDGKAFEPWIPQEQRLVIEQGTGMKAETFWDKYKEQARKDLCHPEGNMNKMWQKYKDWPTKDVVKMTGSALTGMGLSHNLMGTVGVAASVVLLHVALNIGLNAVCDGYVPEETAEARAPEPKNS